MNESKNLGMASPKISVLLKHIKEKNKNILGVEGLDAIVDGT